MILQFKFDFDLNELYSYIVQAYSVYSKLSLDVRVYTQGRLFNRTKLVTRTSLGEVKTCTTNCNTKQRRIIRNCGNFKIF